MSVPWLKVRTGLARKCQNVTGEGLYEISRAGAFKLYILQHQIPENGPSIRDMEAITRWPGRFKFVNPNHCIEPNSIFIYGDEVDPQGRAGLVLQTGSDFAAGGHTPPRSRYTAPSVNINTCTPQKIDDKKMMPSARSRSPRRTSASGTDLRAPEQEAVVECIALDRA